MAEERIRGYRIQGDRPKDRQLSMEYLQQSPKAARLLKELWDRAPKEGANCVGKPEKWTSDELPTDREAQIACAGCPLASLCSDYAGAAHPAWGVYSGRVYGRKLKEAMEDDEADEVSDGCPGT